MFFHYALKLGGGKPKFTGGSYLVSCLSCYKTKLLIYCYPFDDERIKSLESSHDPFSLIIKAHSVRRVSGWLLCPVGWHSWECTDREEWGGSSLFFPVAVILLFEACKSSTTCHTVTHCSFLESPATRCALSLGCGTLEVVVGHMFTWLSN